jgi:phosphoglycerate dehydrogenase-like enzyme
MRILFAAPENAWGGFYGLIRKEMPEHRFEASGRFGVDTLKGYDILIPTMCRVTGELLADSDRLRLIQQCGAGLDGVDIEAAGKKGIWVANVPTDISGNAESVAELGIYLMIGLARNVRAMGRCFGARKMGEPQGRTLKGRTVGLVGLGGIGRALARRLKGFDVRLIGIKRNNPDAAGRELGLAWVGRPGDLEKLLSLSDYVVLCLPLTEESRFLMNRETFRCMKREAFIINLSRGGIIDRGALEEALASGQIAGAGLDVFWEEPPDPDDPVFRYNVLATPHIAGATDLSINGIVKVVAENIRRLERNERPLHVKNQER